MGLYNYFPNQIGEGVLPVLVMNTILWVALLKNMVRSVLQAIIGDSSATTPNTEQDLRNPPIRRLISATKFKSDCCCCCVCLCGFEADEEVSELSYCKHFFHKGCLDKWFDEYQRRTCPLCRSML